MDVPSPAVRTADASISAVRVPGLLNTMTASKYTPPSGVMKLTLFTFSTTPSPVYITAGMETEAVCPAQTWSS